MRCFSLTKNFQRCKNKGNFLFCSKHKYQRFSYPLVILTFIGLIAGIFQDFVKPISELKDKKNDLNSSMSKPFKKSKENFNLLILPFEPLENSNLQEIQIEETLRRRLLELSEEKKLSLKVKLNLNQNCPSTFDEAKSIGVKFNADLVIWGDLYERCFFNDTTKVCLKYSLVNDIPLGEEIRKSGETGIQNVNSMIDIKNGYLQKDIDYIIYWTLALRAFEKAEYEQALFYFKQLDSKFEIKYEELYHYLALCHFKIGKLESALVLFGSQTFLNPNNSIAFFNLANVEYELKDYYFSSIHYSQAIALNPEFEEAIINRGNAYFNLKFFKRAITDYSQVIKINPTSFKAYNNRATTYNKIGKYDLAISDFRHIIKIYPDSSELYYNRSLTHLREGHADSALFDLNKAIKLSPKDFKLYHNRGTIYYNMGKIKLALTDYESSIKLNPNYAPSYNNRGMIGLDINRPDLALIDFNKSIVLDSTYILSLGNRGLAYRRLAKTDSAIYDFDRVIKINPNDINAHINLGLTYNDKKDYSSALNEFTKVIELDSNNVYGYNFRAITLAKLKKFDLALLDCNKAIITAPNFSSSYFTTARIYSIKNDSDKAVEFLRKAIEFGFRDYEQINNEPDLENIRNTVEFKSIVAGNN